MIDTKAFRSMSYGLYLIQTLDGKRPVGCVANTLVQVTSKPARVSVAINKENATAAAVRETGRYAACVLAQDASMELIGTFGFHSSADTDKFAPFETAEDSSGVVYVAEQSVARLSVSVTDVLDAGTHLLFVGDVVEAEVVSEAAPMTYAYYHEVKGGKTPPKASSYNGPASAPEPAEGDGPAASSAADGKRRVAWQCTVCGHVEYVEELPDDFVCPVCGMGKDVFEKIFV